MLDESRAHLIDEAKTEEEKARLDSMKELPLEPLGSGSDYTVFLDHLTIASLNMGFSGESNGGIYHSIYDSFDWYTRFSDGTFQYGAALSQINGSTLMRMADADIVPFQFTNYADTIAGYVAEIEAQVKKAKGAPSVDLSSVRTSVERLKRAGDGFERVMGRVNAVKRAQLAPQKAKLAAANKLIYTTERLLGHAAGLPRRDWFKHLVYAPGFYTGYGVKTLPGVREGVEQGAWSEVQTYVPLVAQAVGKLADQVERAAKELEAVLR
ncbi:MAG: transferrin receptor-like dimerization domain-containing protein [Vicinamibacterales bacterium]